MTCPTRRERALALANAIAYLDQRLKRRGAEIRKFQPKASGAVLLESYDCGKNCLGCAHYRWGLWIAHPGRWPGGRTAFLCHRVRYPLRHLPRPGRRRTSPAAADEEAPGRVILLQVLISETQSLIRTRTSLVRALDRLRRANAAAKAALQVNTPGTAPHRPVGATADARPPIDPQARRLAAALDAVRTLERIDQRLLAIASDLRKTPAARRGRLQLRQTAAARWVWVTLDYTHGSRLRVPHPVEITDPGRRVHGDEHARALVRKARRLLDARRRLITTFANASRLSSRIVGRY